MTSVSSRFAVRDISALVVGGPSLNGTGGVDRVCRSIVEALQRCGATCTYLGGADLVNQHGLKERWGYRVWGSLAEALLVAQEARNMAPHDIVVTNGPLGYGVKGRRSLHYYHGTYTGQAAAIGGAIRRRGSLKLKYLDGMLLEGLAGRGKTCLANSPATAREVQRYFGHTCHVVWCPVDTDAFSPGAADRELLSGLGVTIDRPVGLFVGAGQAVKGEAAAIEVIRQFPTVAWLAIGDVESALKSIPWVRLIRRVEAGQMPALLRSVTFVLITSLYESFCLLQAEALACGTPVIAGPTGAAELFAAKGAVKGQQVADPRDVAGFVAALRSMLSDLPAARQAALEGRRRVVDVLATDTWARRFVDLAL
ncbi:MAG TPA: glycosyltransferase family 4 protein [Candidatus Dormibacteraeota bacterium]|nr:glycosyltransferase family 4 protein [Candidatus Dormibacteraeota bacterium]